MAARLANFALGTATSSVGYLTLRENTWERSTAVAAGLRSTQEEIPGTTAIPQVRR